MAITRKREKHTHTQSHTYTFFNGWNLINSGSLKLQHRKPLLIRNRMTCRCSLPARASVRWSRLALITSSSFRSLVCSPDSVNFELKPVFIPPQISSSFVFPLCIWMKKIKHTRKNDMQIYTCNNHIPMGLFHFYLFSLCYVYSLCFAFEIRNLKRRMEYENILFLHSCDLKGKKDIIKWKLWVRHT